MMIDDKELIEIGINVKIDRLVILIKSDLNSLSRSNYSISIDTKIKENIELLIALKNKSIIEYPIGDSDEIPF